MRYHDQATRKRLDLLTVLLWAMLALQLVSLGMLAAWELRFAALKRVIRSAAPELRQAAGELDQAGRLLRRLDD